MSSDVASYQPLPNGSVNGSANRSVPRWAPPGAAANGASTAPGPAGPVPAAPVPAAPVPAGPNPPVGAALALGSLTVATNLRISEPAGESRDRMARAVDVLTAGMRGDSADLLAVDLFTSFGAVVAATSEYERRALLVELTVANPFSPYWFEMTEAREACRIQSLKLVAALSLQLEPDSVTLISKAWRKIAKNLAGPGLVQPAGPLIAVAMPAAVGLAGGLAMSAGLAQLGFGSVLGGGLGMTGGLWLLGAANGASTAATQAAINDIVAAPGFAHLLQFEVCKLVLTAKLAQRSGWFDGPLGHAAETIGYVNARVNAQLAHARTRNDAKAPRVRELRQLEATVLHAAVLLQRLDEQASAAEQADDQRNDPDTDNDTDVDAAEVRVPPVDAPEQ